MPNNLAGSTSPYLLQHADNPVHWEPWGAAAISRAVREDKPIFLSVGYSACHWCHVMAHESFENEQIAAVLNEHFVNIKVDREERPDLDAVYMTAVQLLTRRGGWPMSVFLTPALEPFFAGTYWPPEPRMGMPGFSQVLAAVSEAWSSRREAVVKQAAELTRAIQGSVDTPASGVAPSAALLDAASSSLTRSYDATHGGFGGAPKFPHPMDLRLLLRTFERSGRTQDLEMVTHTLSRMAAGGMHDQLGGGFARYSVDERWLVPHFEKMLYDNALLAVAYLEAFLVTGRAECAAVCRSTLDYLLRDMADPAGGIWSAEDADSEGEEGRFYVWSPAEIAAVLGDADAAIFCRVYDVTAAGNFEGHSILNLPRPIPQVAAELGIGAADLEDRLARSRAALFAARRARVRPGTDDKVLVAWNGLAIDALARAGAALAEPRYVAAAGRAAEFLLNSCRDGDGRLAHQWRQGTASGLAFAEDLACLAEGLCSLYEATWDERWIASACELADRLLDFRDPATSAFFQTSPEHEALLVRRPDLLDNATPSATGMAATALVRLAAFTGRDGYRQAAEGALASVAAIATQAPSAVGQSLLALDMALGPTEQHAIVGAPDLPATAAVIAALRARFRPRGIMAVRADAGGASPGQRPEHPLDALFLERPGAAGVATLYACSADRCLPPVTGDDALALAAKPLTEEPLRPR